MHLRILWFSHIQGFKKGGVVTQDRLYELHAEICKTLSNPWRLQIIEALQEGEESVGALAEKLGISQSHVSQHLAVMREKGVVLVRREGPYSYYRLADPRIVQAFELMREVLLERLSRSAELAQLLAREAEK